MKVAAGVLFYQDSEGKNSLLLIERRNDPFKGQWALPGGFVEEDEDLEIAAKRELFEETGIKMPQLEQFYTFGKPGRDPRGRTISVAYVGIVNEKTEPKAGDDAANAKWFALEELPALAFDHPSIIKMAREKKGF